MYGRMLEDKLLMFDKAFFRWWGSYVSMKAKSFFAREV